MKQTESNEANYYFQLLGMTSIATAILATLQPIIRFGFFFAAIYPLSPSSSLIWYYECLPSLLFGGVALIATMALTIGIINLLSTQATEEDRSTYYNSFMKATVALSALALIADIAFFLYYSIAVGSFFSIWLLLEQPQVVQTFFLALTHPLLQIMNGLVLTTATASFLASTSNYKPTLFSTPGNTPDEDRVECDSTSYQYETVGAC